MIRFIEKYPIITICLAVTIMLLASFPFLEVSIMEARNFITAREMITDNNWLLTTMNGQPRYQKPPLPTWLAALSALLFGMKSILSWRLPGMLMVICIGVTIYFFSKALKTSKQHALINALITITSFYVVAIVIEAPWDIFTHGFMCIAIYCLFHLFQSSTSSWKHALLSGFFIGLSILCKGPISLYALLLPFLIAFGFTFKYQKVRTKLLPIFSLLILAIIVGGWWYLYVRLIDPDTFVEIAKRETSNWSSYNVRPFYYYWSFFTQSGIWTIPAFVGLLYPYMKSRVSNLKVYRLTFYWTFLAIILLSVIPEKKSRYLMPVLIPLALNTGFYIEYLFREFKCLKDKRETFVVYFNFGLIACIGIGFGIGGYFYLNTYEQINWILFIAATLVLLVIGLGMLYYLKQKAIKKVFYLTVLFVIAAYTLVVPLSKDMKSSNYKSVALLQNEQLNIYTLNTVSPEVIWHFGNKLQRIKQDDSTYEFPQENTFGVLTNKAISQEDSLLSSTYFIKAVDTFDLNIVDTTSKQHKKRLRSYYYVLTRK